MRVKAKISNSKLIKNEWYEVVAESSPKLLSITHYIKIKNHTNKIWNTWKSIASDANETWVDSSFFYTDEEIIQQMRDLKIKMILENKK